MNPDIGYLLAFTTGFLGSLHCIGMCGGIVSAFFLKLGVKAGPFPYASYHAGRILVYAMLGAIVAVLGRVAGQTSSFGRVQVTVMTIAGFVVILIGLNMLKILPWTLPFEKVPVKPLKKLYRGALEKGPMAGSFLAGAINGLIPCGLLYAMLINSATLGNPLQGGLLLAFFGAGTLPAMLSVSFIMGRLGARTRGLLYKLAAVVIIIMGLRIIYSAQVIFGQGPHQH